MSKKIPARGFTLIELLVVIGIIAILAAVVIIAINPARQFAQARNSQRQSNVETILNGIGQNLADNKGVFGGVCASSLLATPTASTSIIIAAGGTKPATLLSATTVDLSCLTPTYIPNFPIDPAITSANGGYTGYEVKVDSVGRVMVCAPAAAEGAIPGSNALCVTR